MTKEQMQKEIARLNHKIELELTEIKSLAQRILNGADNPYNITTADYQKKCAKALHPCRTFFKKTTSLYH